MQRNREEFKERIYDLANGSLNLDEFPAEESRYVKNEFADGSYCGLAYKAVYEANCRLCERLGTEEDEDVELIINSLLDIAKYLSLKMYDYGEFFAGKRKEEREGQ